MGHPVAAAAAAPRPRGVAERGFTVDATFRQQVADNAAAFGQFELDQRRSTCPAARRRRSARTLRNPDLADTYRLIARHGTDVFYEGAIGRDIVDTVQHPPVADEPDRRRGRSRSARAT